MSYNNHTAAMTADQRSKCRAIIHTASASAAAIGAGLAQLPGSDNAVITHAPLPINLHTNGSAAPATRNKIAFPGTSVPVIPIAAATITIYRQAFSVSSKLCFIS